MKKKDPNPPVRLSSEAKAFFRREKGRRMTAGIPEASYGTLIDELILGVHGVFPSVDTGRSASFIPIANQSKYGKENDPSVVYIKCEIQFQPEVEKLLRILGSRQDRAIRPLTANLDAFDLLATYETGTQGNVHHQASAAREDQQGPMDKARAIEEAARQERESLKRAQEGSSEAGKPVAKRKRGDRGGTTGRSGD